MVERTENSPIAQDAQLLRFYIRLTRRQQDVVKLVSSGLTNRQVAAHLYIQPCVVAEHLTHIYGELVANGLLSPTERIGRYTLIRLYAAFFARHPELDSLDMEV
jgi:DNA-binding NarL/FixJ family response regulator